MVDLLKQVKNALDELLPAMEADGGGVNFISLENGVVTLQFIGTCLFCPSQKMSADALKLRMQERIPELRGVEIISAPPKNNLPKPIGINVGMR